MLCEGKPKSVVQYIRYRKLIHRGHGRGVLAGDASAQRKFMLYEVDRRYAHVVYNYAFSRNKTVEVCCIFCVRITAADVAIIARPGKYYYGKCYTTRELPRAKQF